MLQRIIGALFSTSRVLKGAGFVPKYAAVLARRVASQVAAPLLVAHGFSGSRSARACPQTTPGTPEKSALLPANIRCIGDDSFVQPTSRVDADTGAGWKCTKRAATPGLLDDIFT